jgi:hypothetical protein
VISAKKERSRLISGYIHPFNKSYSYPSDPSKFE